MSCPKCTFPDGMIIKPDGVNELDPCYYVEKEIHRNVTVIVSVCKNCGHVMLSWLKQDNTEDEYYNEDIIIDKGDYADAENSRI